MGLLSRERGRPVKRVRTLLAVMATLSAVACAGKPAKEAVLLVGRDVNAHWSTVFAPALNAPDREITVVDVAGRTAESALEPWLDRPTQRLIVVPLILSQADPLVAELQEAVASHPAGVVVAPPESSSPLVTGIAQRALRMSQKRSQEGLWIVMDLPPGADPKGAQATVDAVAASMAEAADFRPTVGVVWQGEASASDLSAAAKKVIRPLVVTYSTNPAPLSVDIRNRLHGFRYHLDGEGVLSDPFFQEWLREAVGKAAVSVASPPQP
jgi:hypothetical protein